MFGRIRIAGLHIVVLALCFMGANAVAGPPTTQDFCFIHISDTHNQTASWPIVEELNTPHPIVMEPFGIASLTPSFAVHTGDMTEFGPSMGMYNRFVSYFDKIGMPWYACLGNHDSTWRSLACEIRQRFGSVCYSFDKFGCHFVMLDSAGVQDPEQNIGPEQMQWLTKDLQKVGPGVPVFVAMHHQLGTLPSYENDEIVDILRPYNVVCIMFGHGHRPMHTTYEGLDMVESSSTYGRWPGYTVYNVTGGILRVAFKHEGQAAATDKMLEKPIALPIKRYPHISITLPEENATYKDTLPVKAWIGLRNGEVTKASAMIDGDAKKTFDLALQPGGSFQADIPLASISPGAHYMKLTFVGKDDSPYSHSTAFYVESVHPKVLWRVMMGTASKSAPTVGDGFVYVGGYDGTIRAYDARSGRLGWQYQTGGAVTGQILLLADKIYAGSDDKTLYCLTADKGALVWKFDADGPIYSSPVSDGKAVYFGCGSGAFYSVDPATGSQNWKNTDALYNIEVKPFLANGRVYYGAWCSYVYCLNTADGKLVWKCMGKGAADHKGSRYYSPADCGPVVCNGKVFVADRAYLCSIIDDATGKIVGSLGRASAVGLSQDGQSVYVRKTNHALAKVDSAGNTLWTASAPGDAKPTAPTEVGGVVYTCGRLGLACAVSAADGKVLWQYQATPSEYVEASVGGTGSTAYVVGTDGSLTALAE